MFAGAVQPDKVGFLSGGELRLLASKAALRSRDRHTLTCARSDEICFELGDHCEHVEEEPTYGVGGVILAAVKTERGTLALEFSRDVPRVGE